MTTAMTKIQLLECCEDSLRHDIFHDTKTELEIKTITRICCQDRKHHGQSSEVSKYGPGCCGRHSPLCFMTTRTSKNLWFYSIVFSPGMQPEKSYVDTMIRDRLIVGLHDLEIEKQILGEQNQGKDLKDMLAWLEA